MISGFGSGVITNAIASGKGNFFILLVGGGGFGTGRELPSQVWYAGLVWGFVWGGGVVYFFVGVYLKSFGFFFFWSPVSVRYLILCEGGALALVTKDPGVVAVSRDS